MLDERESRLIYEYAYVPEHLPAYVHAVSGAEPFLLEGYVCFLRGRHLTFVGYPLGHGTPDPAEVYESARKRFRPKTTAVIAPGIWLPRIRRDDQPEDSYFRLDLPLRDLPPEVAYMVRRARRELTITLGSFGKDHKTLVTSFVSEREVSEGHREIFGKIASYVNLSQGAFVLEARKGRELVAFTIVDLGSANYGFYLFNFRSTAIAVPGASDLLFFEMAGLAQSRGKQALNLGLGINTGVRRFKLKWGAKPFLPYQSAVMTHEGLTIRAVLDTLLSRL